LLHSSACAGSLLGSSGFELGPAAAKPPPGAVCAPANLSSASSALVRLAKLLRASSTRRTSAGGVHHARCTSQPSASESTNNVPTVILDRARVVAIKVVTRSPWLCDDLGLPNKPPEVQIVDSTPIQPRLNADAPAPESQSRSPP